MKSCFLSSGNCLFIANNQNFYFFMIKKDKKAQQVIETESGSEKAAIA